jgi:signal peptidase I
MFKTIHSGNSVLVWEKNNLPKVFKKNEIVLFNKKLNDENIIYVKRITAGPGDIIKVNSEELIMNGKVYPHDEIYYLMSDNAKTKSREYINYLMKESKECEKENSFKAKVKVSSTIYSIPNKCYFLIGDNPYESMDSRFFGVIHEDRILGKVIAVF